MPFLYINIDAHFLPKFKFRFSIEISDFLAGGWLKYGEKIVFNFCDIIQHTLITTIHNLSYEKELNFVEICNWINNNTIRLSHYFNCTPHCYTHSYIPNSKLHNLTYYLLKIRENWEFNEGSFWKYTLKGRYVLFFLVIWYLFFFSVQGSYEERCLRSCLRWYSWTYCRH